jgi:hypothetical protein
MPQKVGLTACAGVKAGPARSPGPQSSLEENWSAQYLHRTCRDRRHVPTPSADICEDQDANEGDCGTPRRIISPWPHHFFHRAPSTKPIAATPASVINGCSRRDFSTSGLPGGFLRLLAVLTRLSGDLAGHVLGVLGSLLGVAGPVERGVSILPGHGVFLWCSKTERQKPKFVRPSKTAECALTWRSRSLRQERRGHFCIPRPSVPCPTGLIPDTLDRADA